MKPLLEVLQSGAAYLAKKGVEEGRLNMEHLLAHVLHCRRMDLYLRFDEVVRDPALTILRDLLRRRGEGEPLQHLLGTVQFLDCELVCDHRALVPRPETERLVELLLERYAKAPPARVLDMATGSGCIGLALAHAWPQALATLADISEEALELARMNASRLRLDERTRTLRSDLFDKVTGEHDLITANLPYIPSGELAGLSREVQCDPKLALDGGPDGLDIVRRFLKDAPAHLTEHGVIALEVGHDQGDATAALATEEGFTQVTVLSDLQGVRRFVIAIGPDRPSPDAAGTE